MEIFVRDISGNTVPVEVHAGQSILSLKRKLADVMGIREENQRLIAGGRPLTNSSKVEDCLKNHGFLQMVVEMKGGSGEEEASPEEIFQIASYFITQSPPGEVDYVVNGRKFSCILIQDLIYAPSDVIKLVDNPSILDKKNLDIIMKKHNEDNFVISDVDGKLAMFNAHGNLGDGKYFDPANSRVMKADHQKKVDYPRTIRLFRQELSAIPGSPPKTPFEAYRSAIQKAAEKYVQNAYNLKQPPRVTKQNVVGVYASDSGDINICISALNSKILASFWSGGWNSKFTINVKSKGSSKLGVMVKARVHSFEEGNIQLISKLENNSTSVTVGSPEETAKAIMDAINKIESTYQ
eukprot:591186-Amorphochlora_amoeboformis.AAC.2